MPVPTGLQYQGPVDSGYQSNPISGDTGITAPIGYGSGGYIQSINNQKWTPPITSAPIKVAQSNLSIVQHLFNGMFGSRFS
jgi:hypothetical protein